MFEFFKSPQEKAPEKTIEKKPITLNPNLEKYQRHNVTFSEKEIAAMEENGMTPEEIEKKRKIAQNKMLYAKNN